MYFFILPFYISIMDLKNKVVVVTGGASGIGRGISTIMAEYGATVLVLDINQSAAQEFEKDLVSKSNLSTSYHVDITNLESLTSVVDDITKEFNKIDVLINSAGRFIGAPGFSDVLSLREEDWDTIFNLNVHGTVLVIETVSKLMKKNNYGKIVNIASQSGRMGSSTGNPAYSASKAAVINLTQSYAIELGPHNINVNAICPGFVWTPASKKFGVWMRKRHPSKKDFTDRDIWMESFNDQYLKIETTPEDIGRVAAFLSSESARNITGQSLNVNGGSRMD